MTERDEVRGFLRHAETSYGGMIENHLGVALIRPGRHRYRQMSAKRQEFGYAFLNKGWNREIVISSLLAKSVAFSQKGLFSL